MWLSWHLWSPYINKHFGNRLSIMIAVHLWIYPFCHALMFLMSKFHNARMIGTMPLIERLSLAIKNILRCSFLLWYILDPWRLQLEQFLRSKFSSNISSIDDISVSVSGVNITNNVCSIMRQFPNGFQQISDWRYVFILFGVCIILPKVDVAVWR